MNIKKVTAAIFTLIAVVLIIGAATILFIVSRDEIVSTDIMDFPGSDNPGVGGAIIVHETESGNPVELVVGANVTRVSGEYDDLYRINIVLNQRENKAYRVENASFKINFDNRAEIISKYCSGGGGEYFVPQTDYREAGKQIVVCDFEGNYAHIDITAVLKDPEKIPVNFTYDILGNGMNFANKFPDQSCEIMIP